MARELETAYEIQQSFLPQTLPELESAELAAAMRPALQVGGDFYDLIPLMGKRVGLIVADVSGKGVPAALYMALTRTLLRAFSLNARPRYLSDALESANLRRLMHSGSLEALSALGSVAQTNEYMVAHHSESSMFLTLFYGVYDPGRRLLTYVNGGHNPPLIYNPTSGAHDWLAPTDMCLGLIPGRPYEPQERQLAPGDLLIIYSDGITEAFDPDGNMLERRGLLDIVQQKTALTTSASLTASDLLTAILADVDAFAGTCPQSDDITLLVLHCFED